MNAEIALLRGQHERKIGRLRMNNFHVNLKRLPSLFYHC